MPRTPPAPAVRGARRRIRVRALPGAHFPWYFPPQAVAEEFDLVDSRPDVVLLPTVSQQAAAAQLDLQPALAAVDSGLPTAVFYTLDRWDARGPWRRAAAAVAARATVLAGHQLAVGIRTTTVPLLLPATVAPRAEPARWDRTGAVYDLFFSGAAAPVRPWRRWPPDHRNRVARGLALQQLRRLADRRAVELRRTHHTWASAVDAITQRRRYRTDLDRTILSFSPPGFGYNCYRHSDTWARCRLLLCLPLHERVQFPESALWAAQRIYVPYGWAGDDLTRSVEWALDHAELLWSRAVEGWEYYRRWGPRRRQVRQFADALRRVL